MSKVLVVDDDLNIVKLIKLYLEKEDFTVCTASDGLEALDVWKKEEPSIIVLDIMMPGLDGNGVCREIRKTSEVPIIIIQQRARHLTRYSVLSLARMTIL